MGLRRWPRVCLVRERSPFRNLHRVRSRRRSRHNPGCHVLRKNPRRGRSLGPRPLVLFCLLLAFSISCCDSGAVRRPWFRYEHMLIMDPCQSAHGKLHGTPICTDDQCLQTLDKAMRINDRKYYVRSAANPRERPSRSFPVFRRDSRRRPGCRFARRAAGRGTPCRRRG